MRLSVLMLFLGIPALAGTPGQAEKIRTDYERSAEMFTLKLQLAESESERAELMKTRPDPLDVARRMWTVIGGDLDKAWTVGPAGWFLRVVGPLAEEDRNGGVRAAMRDEVAKVRGAVAKYHVASKDLPSLCMGLVACSDKESLELLRRIARQNPHKEVAGVAALGVAMIGKKVADDPRVMRERLTMLRQAIIDSADVKIDDVTVAELAEEELYIIMNLSKGSASPDLEGVDSGGRPMKLSDHEGKVRLLVFWDRRSAEAGGLFEWVKALRRDARFAGKAFEVIGVHGGPTSDLRELQAEGKVDWPNFSDPDGALAKAYRVGVRPTAYVLGADRKIHFIGPTDTFAELTAAALVADR